MPAADFDVTFSKLLKLPGIGAQTAYDTTKRIGWSPKEFMINYRCFSSLDQLVKLQGNNVLDASDFPEELQILSPLHIVLSTSLIDSP